MPLRDAIAIDLGTTYAYAYSNKRGEVLREPSIVAYRKDSNRVVAAGLQAKRMLGRAPSFIDVVRPLQDGVVANFTATKGLITYLMEAAMDGKRLLKPTVLLCTPHGATKVENKALKQEAYRSGASKVMLVKEPFAGAIGAGLPVKEPRGSMLVDIGGGTSEVSLISLSDLVSCVSIKMAGNAMDKVIQDYFNQRYRFAIGETTAEQIKIDHGSVCPMEEEHTFELKGLDHTTMVPRKLVASTAEVREALEPIVQAIVQAIRESLETMPPELANDVLSNGIMMVGGGACISGWGKLIQEHTGVKVKIADEPLTCVIRGMIEILHSPGDWRDVLINSDEEMG
ncbi:MAG: rod shape-determining protein [Deltaproteobacteria bacterium]|nr:rod shape-determining protein [Deltaproteobacteria bacterium]